MFKTQPVADVKNFQFYNFILSAGAADGDGPALKAAEVDFEGSGGALSSVSTIGFMGGGRVQQAGENFTLIAADKIDGVSMMSYSVSGGKGATLLYDDLLVTVDDIDGTVTATVQSNPRVNPQAKALSEGFLAGMALINQGVGLGSRDRNFKQLQHTWELPASAEAVRFAAYRPPRYSPGSYRGPDFSGLARL